MYLVLKRPMIPDEAPLRILTTVLLTHGLCVSCTAKSMRVNDHHIEETVVLNVARNMAGAFEGRCIRCQADRRVSIDPAHPARPREPQPPPPA